MLKKNLLIKKYISKYLSNIKNRHILKIIGIVAKFMPFLGTKEKNYLTNLNEIMNKKTILKSYPINANLNVTNLCNLRCKFCEIHYFYWKAKKVSGKIFPNNLSLKFINYFKDFFKRLASIELSGATGEPFLNPQFLKLSKNLTNRYKIFCTATTNGTLITPKVAKALVKMDLGSLLFSVHGSDKSSYKKLQGGNLKKTLYNIKVVCDLKKKLNKSFPRVGVNYLVCKENVSGLPQFLDLIKKTGVDYLLINQYYDSRNRLDKKVSFYFAPKAGNKIVNKIYKRAKKIGLKIKPVAPPLIVKKNSKSTLLIVGTGPLEGRLRKLVLELGMDAYIKFTGLIENHSELERLLASCAVGIAPYVPHSDTFTLFADPGKPKVYMATGLPVVITRVPQIAYEIEREKAGIAINYDQKELVDAITLLLSDDHLYKEYRENTIKFASQYSWERIFEDALGEVLKEDSLSG